MEKVGVYTRLSDEDRFKKNKNDDSDSIVNQRSMCIKYAINRGWDVVDIYSDDDFSGAGMFRPEFERLLKDCESGKINVVLCKTQSRFSRDMEVVEKYLHNKFIEWGVRFVSIVDNADTNNKYNKKQRQINGLVNEWYLDELSDNIKQSLKNKREDGLFMGSFAPYGYEKSKDDKHKLVIDPIAAKVVKEIFEMYENGYGYYKICQYLNNSNILTPAQYKKQNGSKFICSVCDYQSVTWRTDTIAKILKNEVYIGNLVQGKKTSLGYKVHKFKSVPKKDWCVIENTHEAIISKETWNNVQKRLKSHEFPIKTGEIHCLSKKVYCEACGKSFMRNVYHVKGETTGKRAYLQCRGVKRFHDCDNNKAIRLDVLENILLQSINELINTYYDKKLLQKQYDVSKSCDIHERERKTLEKEKNNLDKKIIDNKEYYRKLYEDRVKGLVSEEMFKMLSSDYLKEIETMTERKNSIDEEIESLLSKEENKKLASDILKKYKHIDKLNKVVVDEFIDKVYIGKVDKETKTRDIEIVWNFEI